MLLKVFKFLNTTKVVTSRINMQETMTKGFAYHSFQVKAKLKNGKIIFEEAILRGAPMTITASGEHNLQNGQLYLTLLVAPLVTMDRYFAEKPLIGGIFGKIDAIPLSLRGTYDNIQIKLLSPSAVVTHLADIMKKIVKGPIKLIHGGKVLE